MRPRWRKLIVNGDLNAAIRKDATNASGTYAIREAKSHAVVYVGRSSCGKLWKTMLRHFHAPDSFEKVRETGVFRRGPSPYEVALWVTSRAARACRKGDAEDERSKTAEAEWIKALDPARNVDDGKKIDLKDLYAPEGEAFEGLIRNPLWPGTTGEHMRTLRVGGRDWRQGDRVKVGARLGVLHGFSWSKRTVGGKGSRARS